MSDDWRDAEILRLRMTEAVLRCEICRMRKAMRAVTQSLTDAIRQPTEAALAAAGVKLSRSDD